MTYLSFSAPEIAPPDLQVNFTDLDNIEVSWASLPADQVHGVMMGFTVSWQVHINASDLLPTTLSPTPHPIKKRRWRRAVQDWSNKQIDTSL